MEDIDRKVLRILINHSRMTQTVPSIRKLCIKTGRSDSDIRSILKKLADMGYIEWNPQLPEQVKLLESPGRQESPSRYR